MNSCNSETRRTVNKVGLFDKISKAVNVKAKPEPQVISESLEGDKRTVTFDDGSELVWKTLESRKATFILNADKLPSFTSERIDLEGGVLSPVDEKERPTLAYIRDGVKLFEVTTRMKAYKELEQWNGCEVARFIAERAIGDYGPYYKIWMYFKKKEK